MDQNRDFFSFSLIIVPIALVLIYSLLRGGRPPALNLPDPGLDLTFAFDALHYEINIRLETLFKERFGEYYVLPDGFSQPLVSIYTHKLKPYRVCKRSLLISFLKGGKALIFGMLWILFLIGYRKMIRFFYVPLAFRGDRILLPSQLIFPT